MPLFESACKQESCEAYARPVEWFTQKYGSECVDPNCAACGAKMHRLYAPFQVVFTGDFGTKYNDSRRENAHQTGHWVHPPHSYKGTDRSPVWVDSWSSQKRACAEFGLELPSNLPTNGEISADGRKFTASGCAGQWV